VLLGRIAPATGIRELMLYLLVLGSGIGMVTQVLVIAVQNSSRYEELGAATSAVTMFRLIGGSIGTAVLGTIFASRVAALSGETHLVAVTDALSRVFLVGGGVSAAACIAAWFVPELPLRQTVAAASSSVGQEAAEAFSMPAAADRSAELLRGLAILADRDVQRAYIEGLVRRAGVDLPPLQAWLLLRLEEDPRLDVAAVATTYGLVLQRVSAAVSELRSRGLVIVEAGNGQPRIYKLTGAGCDLYDKLATARRERLLNLQADWPPEQRERVAGVLQRLARELVPPRAA
jgi:DNA-binding MarR family transcriptional regulator